MCHEEYDNDVVTDGKTSIILAADKQEMVYLVSVSAGETPLLCLRRSCSPGSLLSCLHGRTRLSRLPGATTPRRRTGCPGRAPHPLARTAAARRQASGRPLRQKTTQA